MIGAAPLPGQARNGGRARLLHRENEGKDAQPTTPPAGVAAAGVASGLRAGDSRMSYDFYAGICTKLDDGRSECGPAIPFSEHDQTPDACINFANGNASLVLEAMCVESEDHGGRIEIDDAIARIQTVLDSRCEQDAFGALLQVDQTAKRYLQDRLPSVLKVCELGKKHAATYLFAV
jgi:hypothetical protein